MTGELVAAKLVPKENPNVQLESEYRFYQMLGKVISEYLIDSKCFD